ncbi:hypothetical protein JCM10207_007995 [Rhodosporidiobolus poonsookiae]
MATGALPPCLDQVASAPVPHFVANDPELRDVPFPFVRQALACMAPRLVAGCKACVAVPAARAAGDAGSERPTKRRRTHSGERTLPTHVPYRTELSLDEETPAVPPTHFLAVSFPRTSRPSPTSTSSSSPIPAYTDIHSYSLTPIHALPFALNCATLAPLLFPPPSNGLPTPPPEGSRPLAPHDDKLEPLEASPALEPSSAQAELPVVDIALPDPAAFALLYGYIYTSDIGALLRSLLNPHSPLPPPKAPRPTPASAARRLSEADAGASAGDPVAAYDSLDDEYDEVEEDDDDGVRIDPRQITPACFAALQSVRETATLLQVTDDELWDALDWAWGAAQREMEERAEWEGKENAAPEEKGARR